MADSRKYYYLKLKENFFDSNEMIILENMPDGYKYSNILLKMYLRSLQFNGMLAVNEKIPFNPQFLAAVTRHSVGDIEKAVRIFKELGLIEVLDGGAIFMNDIQKYIGKSSTEAERVREFRERKKAAALEMRDSDAADDQGKEGAEPMEDNASKQCKFKLENEILTVGEYESLVMKYPKEIVDKVIMKILDHPYHHCLNEAKITAWCGEAMEKAGKKKNRPVNRFNNFEQREYDWDELERKLLNHDTGMGAI